MAMTMNEYIDWLLSESPQSGLKRVVKNIMDEPIPEDA